MSGGEVGNAAEAKNPHKTINWAGGDPRFPAFYKKLIALRRSNPAFTSGAMTMAAYSVVCFLVAPLMPAVPARLGRRLHALALATGGIGMLSVGLIHTQSLLLPMAAFGIAWASILAMPYAILSVALPPARMDVYMGIFNFLIVLPQLVYSLLRPLLIRYAFHGDPLRSIRPGASCFLVAAVLAVRVTEA